MPMTTQRRTIPSFASWFISGLLLSLDQVVAAALDSSFEEDCSSCVTRGCTFCQLPNSWERDTTNACVCEVALDFPCQAFPGVQRSYESIHECQRESNDERGFLYGALGLLIAGGILFCVSYLVYRLCRCHRKRSCEDAAPASAPQTVVQGTPIQADPSRTVLYHS